jgi:hypothetical protein
MAEISYDLVMGGDMEFVEGTYRLAGGDWRAVIVSRYNLAEMVVHPQRWDSGASGLLALFSWLALLDRPAAGSRAFGSG